MPKGVFITCGGPDINSSCRSWINSAQELIPARNCGYKVSLRGGILSSTRVAPLPSRAEVMKAFVVLRG